MTRFLLRRLGLSIITLLLILTIVFVLTRVLPSDPARQIAGAFASAERVATLEENLGLNDPLPTQYIDLLTDVATLDFGTTPSGESVMDQIRPRLWNSAKLVLFALLLTLPLSVAAGIFAARRRDTFIDRSIVSVGLASSAIPDFVSGVLLQFLIGVQLGWLPPIAQPPNGASFVTELRYITLPALAIVAVYFGYIARITRAGAITAFDSDYARTAYMKGLGSRTVMTRHILRNALQPTVAVTGTQIGYLFGGLVGLEVVFNYAGLGRLIFESVTDNNFPLLQAAVVVVAIIYMFSTLAADAIIAAMNPRTRFAGGDS